MQQEEEDGEESEYQFNLRVRDWECFIYYLPFYIKENTFYFHRLNDFPFIRDLTIALIDETLDDHDHDDEWLIGVGMK